MQYLKLVKQLISYLLSRDRGRVGLARVLSRDWLGDIYTTPPPLAPPRTPPPTPATPPPYAHHSLLLVNETLLSLTVSLILLSTHDSSLTGEYYKILAIQPVIDDAQQDHSNKQEVIIVFTVKFQSELGNSQLIMIFTTSVHQ